MRFPSAAVAVGCLPVAIARIYGVAVPSTIRPGDNFTAIILSSNYIQSVYDVAIAFGHLPVDGYPGILGSVIGSYYLGPGKPSLTPTGIVAMANIYVNGNPAEKSNQLNNFTKLVTLPPSVPKGMALITASLMSLYGASSSPILINYNVTVRFGDETSTDYISSVP
jgi:hypothetical protein